MDQLKKRDILLKLVFLGLFFALLIFISMKVEWGTVIGYVGPLFGRRGVIGAYRPEHIGMDGNGYLNRNWRVYSNL